MDTLFQEIENRQLDIHFDRFQRKWDVLWLQGHLRTKNVSLRTAIQDIVTLIKEHESATKGHHSND